MLDEADLPDDQGLICAYHFDGTGKGTRLGWDELDALPDGPGFVWIHLFQNAPRTQDWLENRSRLDRVVIEALLNRRTRPRCTQFLDGLLVDLRGLNLDPTAAQRETAPLHVWVDNKRIITVRRHKVLATMDVRKAITQGVAPKSVGELLADIVEKLIERMEPAVEDLSDAFNALEGEILEGGDHEHRQRLNRIRRRAILLHNYIAPQRTALAHLASERVIDLPAREVGRLRDIADDVGRYMGDLESLRERGTLAYEELADRVSEKVNRNIYNLTVVATVFMPLTLLTGLLGVNLGGIPGADSSTGFLIFCVLLVAVLAVEIWYLARRYRL